MTHHNRHSPYTVRRPQVIDRPNVRDGSDDELFEISPTSGNRISSTVTTRVIRRLPGRQQSIRPRASASPVLIPQPLSSSRLVTVRQLKGIVTPYGPISLRQNSGRYHILPAFPTSMFDDQPPLLLANVSRYGINKEQLAQRNKNVYPLAYTINQTNSDIPSYFHNEYHLFINSLSAKYHVDEAILDYNLYRMFDCFRTFADDCIKRLNHHPEQFNLDHIQKKIALEFYLQIDVDVFFMKTCSFRGAEPRSAHEGLFCYDLPDARYGLFECGNCPLCKPSHNTMRHRQQPIIQFDSKTRNIIYVMTCPCNKFEYIGETGRWLGDRLWYHRKHANRIIHEFLIGEKNVELARGGEPKDVETLVKDGMRLYKHAARCPLTIQMFLNFNPTYSCFIPIPINKIAEENQKCSLPSSLIFHNFDYPIVIASKDQRERRETHETHSDHTVHRCMRNLPPVPLGYGFSRSQRLEQFQYFKVKENMIRRQDLTVNLFNVGIVAVLPPNISVTVRRFIEALFITHTEAKLNTFGRLCDENDDNNNKNNAMNHNTILGRGEWCRGIVFPH
ncbi:unnamed protein product [Adineta steineri]|uniref:GIY-YIG domain-containing protein n=2 Tax=Adineta steineri TaxID=433720 RepID=A0A819NWR7_9BILA|nr:unnamed protein product [Adineta steineri]CAF4004300.1 unnamed protein product [Adineta steineri]CAF4028267.1 unnamed protein product [Adineta steineri]CAF4038956.1 unnamed protein product [Adineta steineri]